MILEDIRPPKEPTQEEMVLNYLREHKSITGLEALRKFGIMRLAARIHYLKKYGYNVKTELVSNGKKKWAEYSLEQK